MTLSSNQPPRFSRSGFTLVEMLVAMTLTLVLFFSVAQMFSQLGGIMEDGRALIEMSGELRGITHTLQQDLDNRTVEVQPWIQPGSNQGYFEIIEGPDRDGDFVSDKTGIPHNLDGVVNMGGDADDVLAFTAYSKDEPFVGLIQGELKTFDPPNNKYKYWVDRSDKEKFTAITSQYAEIIYWTRCTPNDDRQVLLDKNGTEVFTAGKRDWDETVTLYRRVLLIRPDIRIETTTMSNFEIRNNYDLSVSPSPSIPAPGGSLAAGSVYWKTNSLEDLQSRMNRYAHLYVKANAGLEPNTRIPPDTDVRKRERFPLLVDRLETLEELYLGLKNERDNTPNPNMVGAIRERTGEDVVLSKVLAFDVRVFDPKAPIDLTVSNSVAIQPGDLGFNLDTGTINGEGAYVDLGWDTFSSPFNYDSIFSRPPNSKSRLNNLTMVVFAGNPTVRPIAGAKYYTYDTWPFLYEMDGIDSDVEGNGLVDQGTNGFDDNSTGIIDDAGELETSPPYPEPLRGIQVQIRVYEDGTRQIRQDTVMGDFIPE